MTNVKILDQAKIDDWRWQIVLDKNANFDGAFYTGVTSTGIYCKPSCSARRPKRENVTFFDTPESAENRGFRACRRCHPKNIATENAQVKIVRRVCEALARSDENELSLEDLSHILKISPSYLQRTFKTIVGVSPKEFVEAQRFENFKRQAKETDVTTALYNSGFNSTRALYEKATINLGMTPATYRKSGKSMKISFTIVDCNFGKLLVAATEKGVCSIKLGDDENTLENNLKTEFSAADIGRNDHLMQFFVKTIVDNFGNQQTLDQLPLDLQATTFQLRVWAELRKIPLGETRSYQEIARLLGNSKAVRAVARACASNPIAIVTPCHRVIGSDKTLTGYRWGLERKKQILEAEKSHKNQK